MYMRVVKFKFYGRSYLSYYAFFKLLGKAKLRNDK